MEDKDTVQALRITYLLSLIFKEGLSAAEQEELDQWAAESPENKKLIAALLDDDYRKSILDKWTPEAAENSLQNVKGKMRQLKRRVLWTRIAAAASVIMVLAAGLFLYISRHDTIPHSTEIAAQNDVKPGKNTATLTLADGSKVVLSDVSNGKLAEQAGVVISKTADGQVVYQAKAIGSKGDVKYNTLSTAKGETYQIALPDGTKVWLNAATSLKFPSTFAFSANRNVELSGEAYFEVAKDKKHPFVVRSAGQDVEVLGTHFNINSYADETNVKTTLLEGSVRVSSALRSKVLKPNQQSVLSSGNTIDVQPANLEETMAWKNGYFKFNDENLESVMRKLERWYDVEVIYDGEFENEGFSGKISRSRNISKVLKILESTKTVHFKVEGRRITVIR